MRALHWANKKDSDDREKLRKDEIERRQTNAMLALWEQFRKEAADISYNQWLEKKSKQANGPSPRERKPTSMTYTRSTVSSRGASKSAASVSVHKSNLQLTSSIKVNLKQAKRNVASVGKPEKMQPYTNYPPKSSGSRTSVHFLSKSRSEPPRSGRTSRSTVQSAASVPAGVKYYSKIHHRQTSTIKRANQKQMVEDIVESKEAHGSGYEATDNQEEQVHKQLEEQELKNRVDGVVDQNVEEIDKEQLLVTVAEDASKGDGNEQNLEEINIKDSGEEDEGSSLYPQEEEEIDELDFSKLMENDVFNECTMEGDEEDLFHDVGQTNSLNALSLPNTLTKDRTPAEVIQLLRSFGGLSRSYNRSNSFSHGYSMAHRNQFQRRFSLGAIPEGQIVTNYNDEDHAQSSSQLLDEQFLESLLHGLSGDSRNANKTRHGAHFQIDLEDGNQNSEPESDDSETPSSLATSDDESPADSEEVYKQVEDQLEQKSALPKVEITQDDNILSSSITHPQSLKIVNLAWDPVLNTVTSCISESPLSPPDFSKLGGRYSLTRRLTPQNNTQSCKRYSPTSSQASTQSQSTMKASTPSSPRHSPRDLSPSSSSSSSSVHSQPRSPRSLSSSLGSVIQPSATGLKVEDLTVSENCTFVINISNMPFLLSLFLPLMPHPRQDL